MKPHNYDFMGFSKILHHIILPNDTQNYFLRSCPEALRNTDDTINRVNVDQNLDKTRKIEVVWTKLRNGEDLSQRKKINSNEKPGPTSYATRNIDNTKLSAFMMNFDVYPKFDRTMYKFD
ncbi:hypothetical protein BpHYR1_020987 [Brachionus plicatilis]|uniref:Uncharacterized protein n=1 Tax=Brachionus plicatilis TaxID=10195 RepID=A0A3M7T219_BRAPC|nr:hypothetical protein BpHYR1_020987 [Brachionus plicatilis]